MIHRADIDAARRFLEEYRAAYLEAADARHRRTDAAELFNRYQRQLNGYRHMLRAYKKQEAGQ